VPDPSWGAEEQADPACADSRARAFFDSLPEPWMAQLVQVRRFNAPLAVHATSSLADAANRINVDQGLTGPSRDRPGLREALAACREGDMLVVTKLDQLARSWPDARAIADALTARQVRVNPTGSVYDLNDPVGGCCSPCWPWLPGLRRA
jgi:hypothetical protein